MRVLDQGSISAAARSLDLSVAVASQRLKRLEQDLGVCLLHRTTRRLHPTPEGIALAEQGRTLVEDLEALTSGLRQGATDVVGTLRLTASASFGRQYVSPLLPAFMARYPGVRLSVNLTDELQDLVSAGFDLAIRIGALHDSQLVARKLAVNRRVLCASPDYLRRFGMPNTPEELTQHECLMLAGRGGRQDVWRLHDVEGQLHTVRVSGRLESTLGELLRDAALAGLGIAHHSTWHVCDDLRAGRLKIVLPAYSIADTGIYAVMPQRRLVPLRVRAFVDFLAEQFGELPPWERGLAGSSALPAQKKHATQGGALFVHHLHLVFVALMAFDASQDLGLGFFSANPAFDLDPLALLEILVVLEEVADAFQPVRGHALDVVDMGVAGENFRRRNHHQLLVAAGFVGHLQHADRMAADHRARNQRQGQDHQCVERVAVATQGARHVTVVARIAHGGGKDAVHEDRAAGLVYFVFNRFRILRNLDDDVDFVRHVAAGANQIQAHGALLTYN
jgi:DNA-binding transcriptional LysR family regulator